MRTFPKLLSVAISSKPSKDKEKTKPVLVPLKDASSSSSVDVPPASPTKVGIFKSNSWNALGGGSTDGTSVRGSTTTIKRLRSHSDAPKVNLSSSKLSDSRHLADDKELEHYARWVDYTLSNDPDISDMLPLHQPNAIHSEDTPHPLLTACSTGVLLIKLLNQSIPGAVDMRKVHLKPKGPIHRRENCAILLAACKAAGLKVHNIGPEDIVGGVPHLLLGLIWQIIKVGLMNKVKSTHLTSMGLDPSHTPSLFANTDSHEAILLTWCNSQLRESITSRTVANLNTDLEDCEVYAHLLLSFSQSLQTADETTPTGLADIKARIGLKLEKEYLVPSFVTSIMEEKDLTVRATKILAAANGLGLPYFLMPEDIVHGNRSSNLMFIAQLYTAHHAITPAKRASKTLDVDRLRQSAASHPSLLVLVNDSPSREAEEEERASSTPSQSPLTNGGTRAPLTLTPRASTPRLSTPRTSTPHDPDLIYRTRSISLSQGETLHQTITNPEKDLITELTRLNSLLTDSTTREQALLDRTKHLEEELARVSESGWITALINDLETALGQTQKLEGANRILRGHLEEVMKEHAGLKREHDVLLSDYGVMCREFRQKLDDAGETLEGLTGDKAGLIKEVGRLTELVERVERGKEIPCQKCEKMRVECEKVTGQLEGVRGECEGLKTECEKLGREAEQLRGEVGERTGECEGLKTECEKLRGEVEELRADVGVRMGDQEVVEELKREVEQLRAEVVERTADKEALEKLLWERDVAWRERCREAEGEVDELMIKLRKVEAGVAVVERGRKEREEDLERVRKEMGEVERERVMWKAKCERLEGSGRGYVNGQESMVSLESLAVRLEALDFTFSKWAESGGGGGRGGTNGRNSSTAKGGTDWDIEQMRKELKIDTSTPRNGYTYTTQPTQPIPNNLHQTLSTIASRLELLASPPTPELTQTPSSPASIFSPTHTSPSAAEIPRSAGDSVETSAYQRLMANYSGLTSTVGDAGSPGMERSASVGSPRGGSSSPIMRRIQKVNREIKLLKTQMGRTGSTKRRRSLDGIFGSRRGSVSGTGIGNNSRMGSTEELAGGRASRDASQEA
ncbi:hypothetical protein HDV00_005215 [Rhizophlyctis rosea]|nr:hypothetical protein HDV00_005215 [Rhizophlyctis rosea]